MAWSGSLPLFFYHLVSLRRSLCTSCFLIPPFRLETQNVSPVLSSSSCSLSALHAGGNPKSPRNGRCFFSVSVRSIPVSFTFSFSCASGPPCQTHGRLHMDSQVPSLPQIYSAGDGGWLCCTLTHAHFSPFLFWVKDFIYLAPSPPPVSFLVIFTIRFRPSYLPRGLLRAAKSTPPLFYPACRLRENDLVSTCVLPLLSPPLF